MSDAIVRLRKMVCGDLSPGTVNYGENMLIKDVQEVLRDLLYFEPSRQESSVDPPAQPTCPHCGKSTRPQTYGERVAEEIVQINSSCLPPIITLYHAASMMSVTPSVRCVPFRGHSAEELANGLKSLLTAALDEAFDAGMRKVVTGQ
jgi:hypothetical protein